MEKKYRVRVLSLKNGGYIINEYMRGFEIKIDNHSIMILDENGHIKYAYPAKHTVIEVV